LQLPWLQVPSSSPSLTLQQLLASFPLDKSAVYHFRFKVKDDRYGWAWQDVRDPSAAVPVANGVIYAKVMPTIRCIVVSHGIT
jgi:hypothetical protein